MKKGDVRRQAILDAAEQLFFLRGYDDTSIQDILDVLKLSKGGFYHHFESKHQLLEEICAQRVEHTYKSLKEIFESSQIDPIQRLNLLFRQGTFFGNSDMRYMQLILRTAYRGGLSTVKDRMRSATIERLEPLLHEILLDGMASKAFYTPYADQVPRILLMLGIDLTDEVAEMIALDNSEKTYADVIGILQAYRRCVEQLINAPYGSIEVLDVSRMMQAAKAYNSEQWQIPAMPQ